VTEDDYPYGCYAYVLAAVDGSRTYVGWSTDVEARLTAHNAGKGAKSTRGRQWVLVHSEKFRNKSDAMSREWHLKRDRKFRKQLLEQAKA
jgi:putative endonuclease